MNTEALDHVRRKSLHENALLLLGVLTIKRLRIARLSRNHPQLSVMPFGQIVGPA